jgi:uncharacterized protein (TIGR02246 family)
MFVRPLWIARRAGRKPRGRRDEFAASRRYVLLNRSASDEERTMSENRTNDTAAITAVLEGVYKAWDANDADAFVAEYTDDATAILPGSYRKSKQEIRESMAMGFSTFLKGTTTTDKQLGVRFLGRDAAIVVSETGILFPGETEVPADRVVYATWVLEKRDGTWLLAGYHNSPASMPG